MARFILRRLLMGLPEIHALEELVRVVRAG